MTFVLKDYSLKHLGVLWGTFVVRVKILSRYKGSLILDIIIPTLFASIPILLGQAFAGSIAAASTNFQENTGLRANYVVWIIIGANVFGTVMESLWMFGLFVRREQMLGTLEAIVQTPAHKLSILGGLALYVEVKSVFTFILGYLLGCILFNIDPLQGNILLALILLLIGLVPIFGLSFLLGALIMKVKQANSLVNTLQWLVGILMGVFFPITVLPVFLQVFALIFPGFYLNYDIQAALTGLNWFLGNLYLDLSVIFLFALMCPFIGYQIFTKTEYRIKKAEGIGQF
ncbi:MAG: ABC transporter permease [Candidatus Heimdallarchaeota archaeon]|nr:MAG: ABC transporter permease [Candidatus Heimdallarchaeota archaeon]